MTSRRRLCDVTGGDGDVEFEFSRAEMASRL